MLQRTLIKLKEKVGVYVLDHIGKELEGESSCDNFQHKKVICLSHQMHVRKVNF
jgi:hypothetical protein